jgi:hypothetical protein
MIMGVCTEGDRPQIGTNSKFSLGLIEQVIDMKFYSLPTETTKKNINSLLYFCSVTQFIPGGSVYSALRNPDKKLTFKQYKTIFFLSFFLSISSL